MPELEEQVFFHLTGARANGALLPVAGLRPALFARFGDLQKVRHDYPVVLSTSAEAPDVVALSAAVDELLAKIAPEGIAGERLRRTVLRIEREIRDLAASGAAGTLGELWDRAVETLRPRGGAPFVDDTTRARNALTTDGQVAGFDTSLPRRQVGHVWRRLESQRAATMRRRIDMLALKLSDLVKADYLRSEPGRHAATLEAGVGTGHRGLFDFDLMAKLLAAPSGQPALSTGRRARIDRTLAALRAQRFFGADDPYAFAFDRVDDALAAYRERLGAMAELVRAITVAELELSGGYAEETHDPYFDHFDTSSLSPEDLALFPTYLVWLAGGVTDAAERARIVEGLTSGAPLKILFATDDAFGLGTQLATTAMGLGDAFVLQSSSAQLYRVRDRVRAALAYPGAALMSVYVPGPDTAALPTYLVAAAATEARAFPTFSYDPSAGVDWAQRFTLHDDPQPDRVWPEHELAFADERMQRQVERVAFTLADFAICDRRYAAHFARVARAGWNDQLLPLASWLEAKTNGQVPYVYAVDADAELVKLVVDERLAQQVRRAAQAWHRLRELDDLKRERVAVVAAVAEPAVEAVAVAPAAVVAEPEPAPAAPSSDEAYIETPRCTTCNECTNLNPRLFAYNENKQAFIKDRKAGTYADLVQAAENCQVAIIHPGKPIDMTEPGLDDLLKRAEAFL